MTDNFVKVHTLLKQGKYQDVLNQIFNRKTGQIKKAYKNDLNHAWYIVGDTYYKLNNLQQAVNAFKKSYKYRNEDVESILAIANCYSELKRPKDSEKYLKLALRKDSENRGVLYNLGNALFDQGLYNKAMRYYEKIGTDDKKLFKLAKKNISTCKKNKRV